MSLNSADDSGLIAYPGVQTGNIAVTATTDFQGPARFFGRPGSPARAVGFTGRIPLFAFEAMGLDINEFETFVNPVGIVPVGSTLLLIDHFNTLNEFQGADLGTSSDRHCCNWKLGLPAEGRAGRY